MSLIDDRKSGYTAQAINAAPIYPGAAWTHKFVIETNDLTGFIFEIYARETVRSSARCFNIDFTVADEDGKKVLYPLAVNTTTKKAFLNKTVFVTCQFTETATGNTYIEFEGAVAVGAGSLSGIVEVPTIPGIVTVSDGVYGDITVTGSGLNWAVKESAVTKHQESLSISGNQVSVDSQTHKVLDGLNSQTLWDQADGLLLDGRSTGIKSGGNLIDLGGGVVRVEAGSGAILDNTDTGNQSYASIDWAQTDLDLSANDGLFWICIDFNEQITFTANEPGINDYITVIWLWRVFIQNGLVVGTLPQAQPIQQIAPQIKGIYEAIGDKKTGMALNAASTDLSFSYSAGMVFDSGIGFFTGLPPFNSLDIAALSPVVFQHVNQNNIRSSETTQLDVGNWDNAGTTEAIPGNGARSQVFTVFISPFSLNVRVIRGQEFYSSAGEAFTALQSGTYNPIVPQQIIDATVLIGWVIAEKSATDLSDGNQILVTSNRDGTIGGSVSTSGAAALLANNNLSDLGDLSTAKDNLNYFASEIPANTANFSENLTASEANVQLALEKLSKTRKSLSIGYNVVFSNTLGTVWLGHQNNGRLTVNSNAGGDTNPVLNDNLTSFGAINAGSESGSIIFDFAYSIGSFDFVEICAMIIDRVTLIETFIKKTVNVTAGGRQYEEFDLSSYLALNNSSIYIFYRATTAPAASESFNVSVSLI